MKGIVPFDVTGRRERAGQTEHTDIMSLINHLFKSRESESGKDNQRGDPRESGQPLEVSARDEGNRSFTYRPTGPDGVKPTHEANDRESRTLK